ncbi:MAG: S8 family serine peptidase [Hyphomicrobiaceae bacterium]
MRGVGAKLGRAAVIVAAFVCALALSFALLTDPANAKKKRKPKPDAFDQLKTQTSSDSGEQAKQAAEKSSSKSDDGDDKSGKGSETSGQDSAGTSGDGKEDSKGDVKGDVKVSDKDDGKEGTKATKREGTGKSADRDSGDNGGPPKTVEEWLKGLTGPKPPQAAPVQADKPDQTDAPAHKGQAAQTPGAPKPSTRVVRDKPLELDVIRPEVLVKNLSQQTRELAVKKGFTDNGETTLTQLATKYTKLGAPIGMSASEAFEFLQKFAPEQRGGPNEAYRIYKTATAGTIKPDAAEMTPPPTPMATTCGSDRCFAQTLIGWRPQLQSCTKNLRIGVIDTGIDKTHPAFKSRRIEARQEPKLRSLLRRPVAPKWHGTGVLALLAGEPHSDTPGLIPDAHFYVADVFYADADGLPVSDTASILEALNWLASRNVNIVNMSLTGPHDAMLKTAIEDLSRKGILFVAAVGNDGPGAPPAYPSAYAPVVAVSAVNKNYGSYRYANQGDHVDLAAPGVDIWTAMPEAQAAYHSGTSFAVPYATAMVASVFNGLNAKTKAEALGKLSYLDLGVPGRDPVYGRGLAIAPYGCEMGPGMPLKPGPQPQPSMVNVTAVKN